MSFIQSKPNPFIQLAQQYGTQPNPFLTQQPNNSMDIQNTQNNQNVQLQFPSNQQYTYTQNGFQYSEQNLFEQIRDLKINGLDVYDINTIKMYVGEDCGGIDVICGGNGKAMALKYLNPININQTKEIAYFEYCCNIFQNHFKCKLEKIIISVSQFETNANTAINRCGIGAYVNPNKTELFTKTCEHVAMYFM